MKRVFYLLEFCKITNKFIVTIYYEMLTLGITFKSVYSHFQITIVLRILKIHVLFLGKILKIKISNSTH